MRRIAVFDSIMGYCVQCLCLEVFFSQHIINAVSGVMPALHVGELQTKFCYYFTVCNIIRTGKAVVLRFSFD